MWGPSETAWGGGWALSRSILIMSGATFCIGLIPGYATIGIGVPTAARDHPHRAGLLRIR